MNNLSRRVNNTHNTVRKPDNLRMRRRGQPLRSKRRTDWLLLMQLMLLVYLPLMARKSGLGGRALIGRDGRWSDRDHDHVLGSGSGSDLDSDLDSDPGPDRSAWMARIHVYYFLRSQGNELVAAEFCDLHIAVSQLSGGLRKAPWHSGLRGGRVHYLGSATHDISISRGGSYVT